MHAKTAIVLPINTTQCSSGLLAPAGAKQTHDSIAGISPHQELPLKQHPWQSPCDETLIQVGSVTNTFNVPGVEENCFFLKDMEGAKALRQRINECFEISALPSTSPEERKRLLTFVVVCHTAGNSVHKWLMLTIIVNWSGNISHSCVPLDFGNIFMKCRCSLFL